MGISVAPISRLLYFPGALPRSLTPKCDFDTPRHPRLFHTRARAIPMGDLLQYIEVRAVICRRPSTPETQNPSFPEVLIQRDRNAYNAPTEAPDRGALWRWGKNRHHSGPLALSSRLIS